MFVPRKKVPELLVFSIVNSSITGAKVNLAEISLDES